MPFKSRAQRRKFAELLLQGKISDETFEEWNRETGSATLPERVSPKGKNNRKSKRKRKGKGPKQKATSKAPRKRRSRRGRSSARKRSSR